MRGIGKIFSGIKIWHETCKIPSRLEDSKLKVSKNILLLHCIMVMKDQLIADAFIW